MNDAELDISDADITRNSYVLLGDAAEGVIQVDAARSASADRLVERLARGEFYVPTDAALPCGCKDGRPGARVRPGAAGGTLTLVVADDLLEQRYAVDGSIAGAARNVFRTLRSRGYEVGDHTSDQAAGTDSGCGANDGLPKIYEILRDRIENVRQFVGVYGLESSQEDHEAIRLGAARRTEFSTGRETLDVMLEEAGEENIDILHGDHHEVVAVINHRSGTTLDRSALDQESGGEVQAFGVDAWTFEEAAKALYPDSDAATIKRAITAMVYYQIATALALCGPGMRVVVLE